MVINQLGAPNNLSATRPPGTGLGSPPAGPLDRFQAGGDEVSLKVSPSIMNSIEFQQKLAQHALGGIRVRVEVLPESSPAGDPAGPKPTSPSEQPASGPSTPQPAVAAGEDPPVRKSLTEHAVCAGGIVGAILTGATAAMLGALGVAAISSSLGEGVGALSAALGQGGVLEAIKMGVTSNLVTPSVMVAGSIPAAIGGGAIGSVLGRCYAKVALGPMFFLTGGMKSVSKLLRAGQLAWHPQPQASQAHPKKALGALVGIGALAGSVGGFIGGAGLATGADLLSHPISLAHLGAAGLAGGALGALLVGMASTIGAYKLLEHTGHLIAKGNC